MGSCFRGALTIELLLAASAKFKSMLEYIWYTHSVGTYIDITLHYVRVCKLNLTHSEVRFKVIIPCSHINLNPSPNPNPNPNQRFICHVLTLLD